MTKPPTSPAASGRKPTPAELATAVLRPSVLAANTISRLLQSTDVPLDTGELSLALAEQCRIASSGDMHRAEAMLVSQAHALDALFCALTHRASRNLGEYLDAAETYMRLALRAQSQCRATLETLATIKNPPVLIARQANIAHGPQQVNNGAPAAAESSRARESQNGPNKLLEQQNGERLDALTASAASGAYPAMATLAEVHGTKVPHG